MPQVKGFNDGTAHKGQARITKGGKSKQDNGQKLMQARPYPLCTLLTSGRAFYIFCFACFASTTKCKYTLCCASFLHFQLCIKDSAGVLASVVLAPVPHAHAL